MYVTKLEKEQEIKPKSGKEGNNRVEINNYKNIKRLNIVKS